MVVSYDNRGSFVVQLREQQAMVNAINQNKFADKSLHKY